MATDDGVDDHCDHEGKNDDDDERGNNAVDDNNHERL